MQGVEYDHNRIIIVSPISLNRLVYNSFSRTQAHKFRLISQTLVTIVLLNLTWLLNHAISLSKSAVGILH